MKITMILILSSMISSVANGAICGQLLSSKPAVQLVRSIVIPDSTRNYLNSFPGYVAGTKHPDSKDDDALTYFVERAAKRDWSLIAPWIPERADSLLDIGGGVGSLGLILSKLAGFKHVTLVEKDERHDEQGNLVYTHRAARDLYESNGISEESYLILNALDEHLESKAAHRRYDLIISLRALGFLFPYESYRHLILRSLEPRGRLILDVFKEGSDFASNVKENLGAPVSQRFPKDYSYKKVLDQLARDIGPVQPILESKNSVRVVVTRRYIDL